MIQEDSKVVNQVDKNIKRARLSNNNAKKIAARNNVKELNPGHQLTIGISSQCKKKKWWSTIDNLIENFLCSDFNELIIFFKFLLLKDCLFPLPEIK